MNEELEKLKKNYVYDDEYSGHTVVEAIDQAFQAGYDKGRHEAVEQFNKHIETARRDEKSSTIAKIRERMPKKETDIDENNGYGLGEAIAFNQAIDLMEKTIKDVEGK